MNSYQGFFDHLWAREIHALAEGKVFEQALFDLTSSWKGTSSARRIPWLMMKFLREILEGYEKIKTPFPLAVAEAFLGNVSKMMGNVPFTQKQLARMRLVFADVQGRLIRGLDVMPSMMAKEVDRFWDEIVEENDFSLSLWKSEENAYVAVYFAYEDYVVRLTGLGKKVPNYALSANFQTDFASLFGLPMFKLCWSGKPVRTARLVRNAMLHNGGRITPDLNKIDHGLRLLDKSIVLIAPDITALYELLKDRAMQITKKAAQLREMD